MKYNKLNYEQYFIDASAGFDIVQGKPRFDVKYKDIPYKIKNTVYHTNYEVHYEKDRNVIQINFGDSFDKAGLQLSRSYYNAFLINNKAVKLKVKSALAAKYKAIKFMLRNEVNNLRKDFPKAEIEIIGWANGVSQAILCAQDLNYNFGIKSHLYTFGKKTVFKNKATRKYLKTCCVEIYNFNFGKNLVKYSLTRFYISTYKKENKL